MRIRLQDKSLLTLPQVRAHFVSRGSSYLTWARKNGFHASTVCRAIQRGPQGPQYTRILNLLLRQMLKDLAGKAA